MFEDIEHTHLGIKSICILKIGRYKNKMHKKGEVSEKPSGQWNGINASGSWEKNSSQGHGKLSFITLNGWSRCRVNNAHILFSIASERGSESNIVICKTSICSCNMCKGISSQNCIFALLDIKLWQNL